MGDRPQSPPQEVESGPPDATIVVPTYNEAAVIVDLVDAVLQECSQADVDVEVVVVDDDSPDETWRLVEEEFQGGRVQVVRRLDERGLGSAVVRGFREARGEVCVVIDADFQHPPERVPDLVAPFSDPAVDLVVGTRYLEPGGIEGWTWTRRLVSWGGTLVARAGSNRAWSLSDPMSGFFAVRRELVDDVALRPDGYKILLEVVERAQPEQVVEVPYVFQPRRAGESKLDTSETVRFLEHATRLGARLASVDLALAAGFVIAAGFLLTPRSDPLTGLVVGGTLLAGSGVLLAFGWLTVRELTSVEVDVHE